MPDEIVFLSFTSIAAVTFLAYGLMRTINQHLERKHKARGDSGALLPEVDEMRAQAQVVEELRDRVADLEERVDFNERILARQRDRERLSDGH